MNGNANKIVTNIRVANSATAGVTNSSASTTTNNCGNDSGSGPALLVSSQTQMCSTTTKTPPIEHYNNHMTDMIDASHMNNNNNNNSDENQELSVYDVILCVSQAHRSHCSYTENTVKGLNHRPLTMPNSHPTSTPNNLISSSTPSQIHFQHQHHHLHHAMDDNGMKMDFFEKNVNIKKGFFKYFLTAKFLLRLQRQFQSRWNSSAFIFGSSTQFV